ncbi:MAG TPA: hypothetical protein VFE58_01780 [Tepidisphaeraceae bacterium]|nr:hypothetical protein [Tepidisphaeraceae bacterium]
MPRPEKATSVQLRDYDDEKQRKIDQSAHDVIGVVGTLSFIVENVQRKGNSYLVSGSMKNSTEIYVTERERIEMATINKKREAETPQIHSNSKDNRHSISHPRTSESNTEAERQMLALRERISLEKPSYSVAIQTDDLATEKWHKGETRALRCSIMNLKLEYYILDQHDTPHYLKAVVDLKKVDGAAPEDQPIADLGKIIDATPPGIISQPPSGAIVQTTSSDKSELSPEHDPLPNVAHTQSTPSGREITIPATEGRGSTKVIVGPLRKGQTITFKYLRGAWSDWSHNPLGSPDDNPLKPNVEHVSICENHNGQPVKILEIPGGTKENPFSFTADHDTESIVLNMDDPKPANNRGEVVYWVDVH